MAVGELAVNVTARTSKARKSLGNFRKDVKRIGPVVNMASQSIKRMGVAFAGMAAASVSIRTFSEAAEKLDRLGKVSDKLGVTTEALAGLRHAAEQTGVSSSTLDMSLQRLTRRTSEAARGLGEARGALRELNIDATRLNALAPDLQFRRIAERLKQIKLPADRLRIAFKLLDSEGVDLVNTLALGADGLKKMQEEAEELGLAISRDGIKGIEEMNDEIDKLGKNLTGRLNKAMTTLAPVVTAATKLLSKANSGPTLGDMIGGYLTPKKAKPNRMTTIAGNALNAKTEFTNNLGAATQRTFDTFGTHLNTIEKLVADTRKLAFTNALQGKNVYGQPLSIRPPKASKPMNAQSAKLFDAAGSRFGSLLGQASNMGIGGIAKQAAAVVPGLASSAMSGAGGLLNTYDRISDTMNTPDAQGKMGINRALDADSTEGRVALLANTRGGSDSIKKATVSTAATLKQILVAIKAQSGGVKEKTLSLPTG